MVGIVFVFFEVRCDVNTKLSTDFLRITRRCTDEGNVFGRLSIFDDHRCQRGIPNTRETWIENNRSFTHTHHLGKNRRQLSLFEEWWWLHRLPDSPMWLWHSSLWRSFLVIHRSTSCLADGGEIRNLAVVPMCPMNLHSWQSVVLHHQVEGWHWSWRDYHPLLLSTYCILASRQANLHSSWSSVCHRNNLILNSTSWWNSSVSMFHSVWRLRRGSCRDSTKRLIHRCRCSSKCCRRSHRPIGIYRSKRDEINGRTGAWERLTEYRLDRCRTNRVQCLD